MTSSYDERIGDLLADYRRQRDQLSEMQRKLKEISVTATAPGRAVAVTVGAQGEITDLGFPTTAYRRMAPAELATVLLATIADARQRAAAERETVLKPHLPKEFRDLAVGALPEHPPMTEDVRKLVEDDPRFVRPQETDERSERERADGEKRWW
ncbi:YbaB/EbfC family nucleoid-associated protein [Amycolatopsis sp. NPDC049868]|uniref:YbaB/EbfC family nucleoid-associated protein n=1 Tax=Amycolatopsis sp. NPDC049868 TaxID=3363934 RepID=UPI0037ABC295